MANSIRFTRTELEIINAALAIASAAPWGKGDYQGWTEEWCKPYDSLRRKVWERISRMDGLPNHLEEPS